MTSRNKKCHVCRVRNAVGVWNDEHNNPLAACGDNRCVVGYRYVRPLRPANRNVA